MKLLAVVDPTTEFYVNDYAGLLDEETKNYIINVNKKLYSQTGAQIVVVTVPSLEGDSLEDYATELFRDFGIGDKTKNNGLLLLLALKERQFRVEVGYGLEGILPDAKTGRIQDEYIIPYLKENEWNAGIKNGFNAFLEIISNEYNIEVGGETPVYVGGTVMEFQLSVFSGMLLIFEGIIAPIGFFIYGVILQKSKKKKAEKNKIKSRIIIGMFFIMFIFVILAVIGSNITNDGTTSLGDKLSVLVIMAFTMTPNIFLFIFGTAVGERMRDVNERRRDYRSGDKYNSGTGYYSGGDISFGGGDSFGGSSGGGGSSRDF